MVALDVMLVQLCRLPLLCPPTPGQLVVAVVVVGLLLSIVEHPGLPQSCRMFLVTSQLAAQLRCQPG